MRNSSGVLRSRGDCAWQYGLQASRWRATHIVHGHSPIPLHTHSSKIRCKACPIRCKACPNAKSFIASRASLAFTVNSQPSSSKSFTMSSQDTGCTLAIHYEHTLPMAADGFREVSLASIGTMCGWLSVFIRSASLVLGTSLELSA